MTRPHGGDTTERGALHEDFAALIPHWPIKIQQISPIVVRRDLTPPQQSRR
jgi:hypothetical protein